MKILKENPISVLQRLNRPHGYLCPLLISLICLYGLYLRLTVRASRGVSWAGDSLGQIAQMKGSFLAMLKGLPGIEVSGYLSGDHLLIYPFFKLFGEHLWGAAIPHIIITIFGFYLLYLVCNRYLETVWGFLITFLIVCLNATLIWHAVEIRPYAVFPTLALAALYLSELLVEENKVMSRRRKFGIGAYFVLLIWFHQFGIMMLVFPLAYVVLSKVRDVEFFSKLRYTAKFVFMVFLIAFPFWLWAQQLSMVNSIPTSWTDWGNFFSKFESSDGDWRVFYWIANPFVDPLEFLKNIFGNLVGYKTFYFLLVGVLFPFFVNYRNRWKQIGFLLITVFFPIGVILLMAVIKEYFFVQRLFIWVMPFFALFLGWSWESLYIYIRNSSKKG